MRAARHGLVDLLADRVVQMTGEDAASDMVLRLSLATSGAPFALSEHLHNELVALPPVERDAVLRTMKAAARDPWHPGLDVVDLRVAVEPGRSVLVHAIPTLTGGVRRLLFCAADAAGAVPGKGRWVFLALAR